MVRTDGNRLEIKIERPLTEGNEGHKLLKEGDEIKWKLDRQKKKYMTIKFLRARDKEKKSNLQRGIEP